MASGRGNSAVAVLVVQLVAGLKNLAVHLTPGAVPQWSQVKRSAGSPVKEAIPLCWARHEPDGLRSCQVEHSHKSPRD